jgi:hypothetical protein
MLSFIYHLKFKTMKKFFFVASAMLLLGNSMFAESNAINTGNETPMAIVKRDVPPPVVVASFNAIFGNVPVRQWKLRSNGQWRAHFLRNGIPWEATFTSTGILVKSERD